MTPEELLKEVTSKDVLGEPVYQVCKSDSASLSSAWIDVTEQTYNDAGLYPEYGRRILYTSNQLAAAQEEIERLNGQISVYRLSFVELERQRNVEMTSATRWATGYHELRDKLAKAEQRVAEWQPIETAPKDGSVIVVGYGRQGNFPVKVVYWKELHKIWMHYGEWEPGLENNATHWMPLPKAPVNTASS